jgi:RNA-directed DNA polymerase
MNDKWTGINGKMIKTTIWNRMMWSLEMKDSLNAINRKYSRLALDNSIPGLWTRIDNSPCFFKKRGVSIKVGLKNGWHKINWRLAETKMKDLQEKIVIAILKRDLKEVYRLQWVIIQSFEGRALAVRRVISNKGGKTAGIDNVIWNGPKDYWLAIKELERIVNNPNEYKAQPLRRVNIPKGNSKEMRPLGIPTMIDRAVQALYYLGVDPVVETQSDPNSYGFRKSRSTHDAIVALRSLLDKKTHPRWILEADISNCFDKISHDYLMKHTPICHKRILEQWLKAGVVDKIGYEDTNEGTPQGGIISPTLCNIALNGIEKYIKDANPIKNGKRPSINVIRYADDLIITGKSRELVQKNKELLAKFLAERGLKLNEKKTLITHIKKGFDFLGFNIRRMNWNSRLNKNTDQDTVLIIKPSSKSITKLKESIRKIININKPISKIISEINPVLRGWGEHKRISYHSQETFITIDHWIYLKMLKWSYSQKGSLRRTLGKCLIKTARRKWNWGKSQKEKIINLGEISIIRLTRIKLNKNPYIKENLEYFRIKRDKIIEAKFRATIYKKFKQLCPLCGESLHNGEAVELHHIIPRKRGGTYKIKNIQPLHQICHQQVTHNKITLQTLQGNLSIKEAKSMGKPITSLPIRKAKSMGKPST